MKFILYPHTRLPVAVLLLIALLLAPFNSIAHHPEPDLTETASDCRVLQVEAAHEGSEQGGGPPCSGSGDCGEHENCCHDCMEPPHPLSAQVFPLQIRLFQPYSAGFLPDVYLAIFVPPESLSLSL